jgi:hypothetical protein
MSTVRLAGFERSRHRLAYDLAYEDLHFTTSIWYESIDFAQLEAAYGHAFMERLYFHIGAFEVNKLCSLRPDRLDFGPFAHLVTDEFAALWRAIFWNVWAQWRYENRLPYYLGPELDVRHDSHPVAPTTITRKPSVEVLAFCGGGKDSLVGLRLLERVGVPYASLAYSSSVYGTADLQHRLIGSLLDRCSPAARHRQWVYDDFLDAPVIELVPEAEVRTITAAETPASIFEALPYALAHGYRYLCLAHERSADRPNMVWGETGEEINHQWGKSTAAETLLNTYIADHLVTNCTVFSILKPVHDVLIFNLLAEHTDDVPSTHSCNVAKPWCGRCPKCAYVWLNYQAYLPTELVDSIFGRNLFDDPANRTAFRQMLGLEAHTPFECVGEVAEARLAFELCHRRGVTGAAMIDYLADVGRIDVAGTLDEYLRVHRGYRIPHPAGPAVLDELERAATRARARVLAPTRA